MTEILQKFCTPDGKQFDSKAEAENHIRRPKIEKVLLKVTDNNKELTEWLLDNQETVTDVFNFGKSSRVTKAEKAKLEAAFERIKELYEGGEKVLKFLADNAVAAVDSFRHPKQPRMTDEEKAVAAKNSLVAATENEELADWIVANQTAVLEAYEAGKIKRKVDPKAKAGLFKYQVEQAQNKVDKLEEEIAELKKQGAEAEEIEEAENALEEHREKLAAAEKKYEEAVGAVEEAKDAA